MRGLRHEFQHNKLTREKSVSMLKKINYLLVIILILLASYRYYEQRVNLANLNMDDDIRRAENMKFYEHVENAAGKFCAPDDKLKVYGDIDALLKRYKLKLNSLSYQIAPDNGFDILEIKKIIFTINAAGRYFDLKNFIYMLDNMPFHSRIESLKIKSSDSPAATRTAEAEIKYSVYALESLKSSVDVKKEMPEVFNKADFLEKDFSNVNKNPVDILKFERSSFFSTGASGAGGQMKPLHPEPLDNLKSKVRLPSEQDRKRDTRLYYLGFYFNVKKGITAFVDFNGRTSVVNCGETVGGYRVSAIDGKKIILSNLDEPFDTIEAALKLPPFQN